MDLSPTANRLDQAQAHAEANPLPTTLKLWRGGVAVEMWNGGRRIERRVTWRDVETARLNPIIHAIDDCMAQLNA